jgi:hypothetical protein
MRSKTLTRTVPSRGLTGTALVAAVSAAVLVFAVSTATAAPYTLGPQVLVSGPSPFAGCPVGSAGPTSVVYTNTEVEPQVAVNPTNPDFIVGNFQQDRWNDGGAKGLIAARSTDGGASWTRNFAAFSACSGNPGYPRTTDPWVSYDKGGHLYQIALSIDSADLGLSAVLASTSDDNGATWSVPVTIQRDTDPVNFNDKESITGDWTRTNTAYATWIRGAIPGNGRSERSLERSFAFRGKPMFSRTTDGGQTWSVPTSMTGNQNVFAQGNQIAVLPDGTLVNVFAILFKGSGIQPPQANQVFMAVTRSTDGGQSWHKIEKIAPIRTALLTDPDVPNPTSLNQTVRADDYLPDIAVDHETGDIYVVWSDGLGTANNNVVITKSTDGGRSWSPLKAIDLTPGPHAFNQTVAVAGDGTVAVLYYDFRNNTPDPGLPTDVWLTQSTDGGDTWEEQHVTGPFDMKQAPVARGYFLGDYMGLEAVGDDDLLAFFATTQGDPANVYAVRANR